MDPSECFRDNAVKYLAVLSDRAPDAGTDVVETIIAPDTAMPYTAGDHRHAPAAWPQGRHDVWRGRVDACKANPTEENLAVHEHTPHARRDHDDIVGCAYRLAVDETLVENEPEKRRNNDR